MSGDPIVYLVDDDLRVREAVGGLLQAAGLDAVLFGSAGEYLAFRRPDMPACIVLDVELPDVSGLDFQARIADGDHPPIVFITGHGTIPATVRAMKRGAVDFLSKPFDDEHLLSAIGLAVDQDRLRRRERAELATLRRRLEALTPRERDVLPLVVSGLLNKQAAAELGISEVTYQIHRSKVMQKMQARSLADLVRMAEKLNVAANGSDDRQATETGDDVPAAAGAAMAAPDRVAAALMT